MEGLILLDNHRDSFVLWQVKKNPNTSKETFEKFKNEIKEIQLKESTPTDHYPFSLQLEPFFFVNEMNFPSVIIPFGELGSITSRFGECKRQQAHCAREMATFSRLGDSKISLPRVLSQIVFVDL